MHPWKHASVKWVWSQGMSSAPWKARHASSSLALQTAIKSANSSSYVPKFLKETVQSQRQRWQVKYRACPNNIPRLSEASSQTWAVNNCQKERALSKCQALLHLCYRSCIGVQVWHILILFWVWISQYCALEASINTDQICAFSEKPTIYNGQPANQNS